MKKDDIIDQKLFETNNLSEFYLGCIINCKWEHESPLLLANAYKQKLNEIVDRYDRMLDNSKQREQLILSFDKTKPPRCLNNLNKSPNGLLTMNATRTSTPNKLNNYSKSSCSSYASTPTTPYQNRTFVRSSSSSTSSSSSFNFNTYNQRATNRSPYAQARSYLNLTSPISTCSSSSKSHSKSELEQRLAAIYYDYDDDDEQVVADDESQFIYDHDQLEPKTPFTNKIQDQDNHSEYVYDYETEATQDLETTINTNAQIIEKSYSNLSKDSGVLVDSYHSDNNSNCIFNHNENNKIEQVNKEEQENDYIIEEENEQENDEASPSSNEEEDECIGLSELKSKLDNKCLLLKNTHETNSETNINLLMDPNLSLKKIFTSKMQNRRKLNNFNNFGIKFNLNQYRAFNKKSFEKMSKNKQNLQLDVKPDYSDTVDASSLVSLLVENGTELNKNINLIEQFNKRNSLNLNNNKSNEINNSNLSLCSNVSSPSPSSTSSASSTETNINNEFENKVISNSVQNINNSNLLKSTNPLFFNYNSLMNVSMLDNIQVANNSLELDNMSSSILMFN